LEQRAEMIRINQLGEEWREVQTEGGARADSQGQVTPGSGVETSLWKVSKARRREE
jgi:mannitol/fructose-specific phosphotransferase system IIA component (Ntr-type)